jgi:Condensation domain
MQSDRADFPVTINQEVQLLTEAVFQIKTGKCLPPFHLAFGVDLQGPLDLDCLSVAVNSIIARHAGLRAAFFPTRQDSQSKTGTFRQRINNTAELQLRFTQLDQHDAAEQEAAIDRIYAEEFNRPFNYQHPPLMRGHVIKTAAQSHTLIFIIHHLAFDLWSSHIFANELSAFYRSALTGRPHGLPAIPAHFVQFAVWQRQHLADGRFNESLAFWRQQWPLIEQGKLSSEELRRIVRLPSTVDGGVGLKTMSFAQGESNIIRATAQRLRTTPFALLVTAFCILLYNYTDKPAISVWANFANRRPKEMEGFIGWATNMHPLGVALGNDSQIDLLLNQVRSTVLSAVQHQQVPPTLVSQSLSTTGPADTLVICDCFNDGDPILMEDHLVATPTSLPDAGLGWFSGLHVRLSDKPSAKLTAVHSKDRFPSSVVECLLAELKQILVAISNHPHAKIGNLLQL